MHHKDNSVPRPFPGGRRMDLAQLAGFTSAFPCARRDAGCENRPETLLLPRESAPGPSLLCHGQGLRVTLPGVLSPARHTERSPPSWRPCPAARPGPPPVGSQAAASGQRRLLQHLRPLPHRQRPARFLWARAGRARAGAPVVSGPRFPFRGPLPLGAALQERPGTPGPRPDPTPVRLKLVSPSPE